MHNPKQRRALDKQFDKEDHNSSGFTSSLNVLDVLRREPTLSTLARFVTELNEALGDSDQVVTIFAPSNEALAGLSDDEIKQVLSNHVVLGSWAEDDLLALLDLGMDVIDNVNCRPIKFALGSDDVVRVQLRGTPVASKIRIPNLLASDGVIHVIDRALIR